MCSHDTVIQVSAPIAAAVSVIDPERPLKIGRASNATARLHVGTGRGDETTRLVPEAHAVRVIDLSGAFRLRDAETYSRWYRVRHGAPELLSEAVYGLPEFYRDRIPGARLVLLPACGHMLSTDAEDLVSSAILGHLERSARRSPSAA